MSTFPSWRNGAIKSRETAVFKGVFSKKRTRCNWREATPAGRATQKSPFFLCRQKRRKTYTGNVIFM